MELDSVEYYVRLVFLYYFMGQIFFDQRFYFEVLEFFVRVVEMNFDNIGKLDGYSIQYYLVLLGKFFCSLKWLIESYIVV